VSVRSKRTDVVVQATGALYTSRSWARCGRRASLCAVHNKVKGLFSDFQFYYAM
jgi:hypothetical protein